MENGSIWGKPLVVFDEELPLDLVNELNSSFERLSDADADVLATRPNSSVGSGGLSIPQKSLSSRFRVNVTRLILAVLLVTLISKLCYTLVSTRDAFTPQIFPKNLALLTEGAYIMEGYTSPPPLSPWWYFSSYKLDPDCVLRPISTECWPLAADASIGLSLGRPALVTQVNLQLDSMRKSAKRRSDALTIFNLNAEGNPEPIASSDRTFVVLEPPVLLSSLILRIRVPLSESEEEKSNVRACLHKVEVIGIPYGSTS